MKIHFKISILLSWLFTISFFLYPEYAHVSIPAMIIVAVMSVGFVINEHVKNCREFERIKKDFR